MPDAYTQTSSLDFDQVAWDLKAYFAFRAENYFDAIADVEPSNESQPGSAVTFTKVADLASATTPLSETFDVDAVALSDSQVTVTLTEFGNAVITTAKLRGTSFLPLDRIVANVLGYNAGVSIDTIARAIAQAGTNVLYATGGATDPTSRATVEAEDKITAHDIRHAVANLNNSNVPTFGGYYAGMIHPHVALDLREETGAAAWRDPHTYSQPTEIWTGEIGEFESVRFMKSPRAPLFADTGSPATVDVYGTLIMGRQAVAKAYSQVDGNGAAPRVVPGPVTDKLRRFVPMGWYWLGNYKIFREESIWRIESSSSIGS